MDTKRAPVSENFVDKTAATPAERFLDSILQNLNPVTAARKVHTKLINKGYMAAPKGVVNFGGDDFVDKLVKSVRLNEIMKKDDLVNPKVLYSDGYGDLIPVDRIDKLNAKNSR